MSLNSNKIGIPNFAKQNRNSNLKTREFSEFEIWKNKTREIRNDDAHNLKIESETGPQIKPENLEFLNLESGESYVRLKRLENLMIKIFLSKNLKESDLKLSTIEMTLLKAVFQKKRIPWTKDMCFDIPTIKRISSVNLSKKKEDQLKFVVKKCIKHMQDNFKQSLQASDLHFEKNFPKFKQKKDYYFYSHYFGSHAKKAGLPLERFFHFRTGGYRYTLDIPNSVTRKSVSLWKMNEEFVNEMVSFIRSSFRPFFEKFNIRKIRMLVSSWETVIEKMGPRKAMESILKAVLSKGCKLPWTMAEVDCAIESTLDLLRYSD